jgi:predicted ATPase/DNA-binding winged helix-turn-helix (wHTH) protein
MDSLVCSLHDLDSSHGPLERRLPDLAISQSQATVTFGSFLLLAAERRFEKDGVPLEIGGRALDILIMLVEHAQKVVSKRDLVGRVWPNLNVDEGSLRFHIAKLRRALGDGQYGNRYIVNIPGRGYSFVAPISIASSADTAGDPSAPKQFKFPATVPQMVGRDSEKGRVASLLVTQRLVTLVGPGGVGKSMMALTIAHELRETFDSAIYFVDLSLVVDASLIPAAIASSLGLTATSVDPTPSLLSFLRDRYVLLVLDGCEHVIENAALLIEMLVQDTSAVHVLATSRESLRLRSECIFYLQPLSCPSNIPQLSASELLAFPAAQFFVDRALANGVVIDPTAVNAVAIGKICRSLDGIPLALELAARRVCTYGIQGLASSLDSELMLHWQGHRTAILRHQTLNATLDWSYDFLTDIERKVVHRLAIFVGTFSLEAAQAVASDNEIDQYGVAQILANLVAKSLTIVEAQGFSIYYRLLNTTRTYLLRLLEESGERGQIARRLAEVCGGPSLASPSSKCGNISIISEPSSYICTALEQELTVEGEHGDGKFRGKSCSKPFARRSRSASLGTSGSRRRLR